MEIVAALEAELIRSSLAGLAKQKGHRRYIKVQDGGQAEFNRERVKRDERYNGKSLLRINTGLSAAEIGLSYKEIWRVEYAFRELKTGLEMRLVRHWTPSRVRSHFGICFLSLVMEATMARLLKERRLEARYGQTLMDLRQVKAILMELNGNPFLLRMELQGQAYDAFQAVGLRPPHRLQPLPQPT